MCEMLHPIPASAIADPRVSPDDNVLTRIWK